MKLDKYNKLKTDLETFNFERNFKPLSTTLYYFSFLGNIFLILFSYFFIKDVTNSIPQLFSGQDLFFTVFIILFMTGYELFKRFSFEQLTATLLRLKKLTVNVAAGVIVCIILVSGSFYLSLNGAHRLIDTSSTIESKLDTIQNRGADSISTVYQSRIALKEQQIQAIQQNDEDGVLSRRQQNTIKQLEADVKNYETERDSRIAALEQKTGQKLTKQESKIEQNSLAFAVMVFFLELIILLGVAFNAYYKWTSFSEMKDVLSTPRYKQLELNINLLRIYFQNGRKKEGDAVISSSKLKALASNSRVQCTAKEVNEFVALCTELEIVGGQKNKRVYNMPFEKALSIIEKIEVF
jgi:hypothetical protein